MNGDSLHGGGQDVQTTSERVRKVCGWTRANDASIIEKELHVALAPLSEEKQSACINAGNVNGKTALHIAAQLLKGQCGRRIVQFLLDRGASVTSTTKRGHTALVYACSRGHWSTVLLLLEAGSRVRVRTVNGDTPLSLATKAIGDSTTDDFEWAWKKDRAEVRVTLERGGEEGGEEGVELMAMKRVRVLLKEREESDVGEWVDYRFDETAVAAQKEHEKTCKNCQQRLRENGLKTPLEEEASSMAQSIRKEFAECRDESQMSEVLLEKASSPKSLPLALAEILREDRKMAELLLLAARDEQLGRAMHRLAPGKKNRRLVRIVVGALLRAIKEGGVVEAMVYNGVSFDSIVYCADAHVAADVAVSHWPGGIDDGCLKKIWARLASDSRKQGGHGNGNENNKENDEWAPSVSGPRLRRCLGGPRVAAWSKALRWMFALPLGERWSGWEKDVEELLEKCYSAGNFVSLYASVKRHDSIEAFLSTWAESRCGGVPADICTRGLKKSSERKQSSQKKNDQFSHLPLAVLPSSVVVTWVRGIDALLNVKNCLDEAINALDGKEEFVSIGVDSEWSGITPDGSPKLCLVQLAWNEKVWLIDTIPTGQEEAFACDVCRGFLVYLLGHDKVKTLGFSFKGDIKAISAFAGKRFKVSHLRDLQSLAMIKGKATPGLASVCAKYLNLRVSKEEQRSNWADRPLTTAQLTYAALDANLLLQLENKMNELGLERGGGGGGGGGGGDGGGET